MRIVIYIFGISSLFLSVCLTAVPSLATLPSILSTSPVVFPLMSPKISSKYGKRKHPVRKAVRHHNGIDLASPKGAHVRAVLNGVVIFADTYKGFGKLVTIRHADGYTSLYGHLNEIRVEPGEQIKSGQIVGRVGSTGLATGPHLHFEWRLDNSPIDPLKVFPSLGSKADG